MSDLRQPTVLLAAMQFGKHVQVGPVREWGDAHDAYEALDGHQSGYTRDERGRLRMSPGHLHAIKGEPVRFYRLRDVRGDNVEAEFGTVERVRSTGVRRGGFVGLKRGR